MQNTETWGERVAHRRSAAYLHVPPGEPAYQDGMGSPILFPYPTPVTAGEVKARHDTYSTYYQGVQQGLPLASCIPMATGLLPLIDPGSFWRRFFYSFFICLFRVVILFFLSEYTDIFFFCLNALWSKGAVLLAYEVWDMCCSWHCVWTAVIWQGKTTYMKYM